MGPEESDSSFSPDDSAPGDAYEPVTGRWSRLIAPLFVDWMESASGGRWLDVGCGTGALIQTILTQAAPVEVVGVDRSSAFIAYARRHIADSRVRYEVGDAAQLPVASNQYDAVVAGLLLHHLAPLQQAAAVKEMRRAARPGGQVAAYVWDYAHGMEQRTWFWRVATALDPQALQHDERTRYPLSDSSALESLFLRCDLHAVETISLETTAHFASFDDYWQPFLAGYGVASAYLASRDDGSRGEIRNQLHQELPIKSDGSIALKVRAFGVKGIR